MAIRINMFGAIISNDDAWLYEWFDMDHVTPRSVSKQLEQAAGQDVEVYINSPGGDVWAGSEIYTALREYTGKTVAKVVGVAASAASVGMCGADTVLMSPTAQVMIHRALSVARGNKDQMDQAGQMLDSVDEGIINAYEQKTGKSREEIMGLMKKETFFNAQEAVANGLADEVMFAQTEKVAASFAAPLFSNEVMDKIKNKLIQAKLTPADIKNMVSEQQEKPTTIQPEKTPENKEEPKKMDMNQFKAEHPDLFAQISNDAEKAERDRVVALQAYAKHPGAESFVNEAIANGGDVASVALKFMEASMKRNGAELQNRKDDAKDSGAEGVENLEAKNDDQKKKEEKDAVTARMAAKAAAFKNGGRK
ncbi:head maturation protease, ClpP-related [Paenibacillus sp. UASWS1643]|uniref:head maturation protease, ClpP-related n=1 Tax=Paenibacillus sp. UASWS1643 TaxID=2580422 RepID=UPI00123BB712|nr:head maturation protease, ClpP-related [Paenibacillus sp. UASWS1643]KAA8750106.1 Clp protease ClpP [Paenibacillus sp. UASWS1643]